MRAPFPSILLAGLVTLTMLLVGACSTQLYSGDRLPKESVATLKEDTKNFKTGDYVTIFEVGGQRVTQTAFGIDVPPGRTRVTILVHGPITRNNPEGYTSVRRTVHAKAGHDYIFEARRDTPESKVRLVIREEKRG